MTDDAHTVKPLGYDLLMRSGARGAALDHVATGSEGYYFFSGPDPQASEGYFEVPKKLAATQEQAEAIAAFALQHYEWGRQAGQKQGQGEAQRFFRMALGLEAPAGPGEFVHWNNPVPLATTDAMKEVTDVQARVHRLATELGRDG